VVTYITAGRSEESPVSNFLTVLSQRISVNTSSWHYSPGFEHHVSSSQASQPSLSGFQCHNCTISVYQGPVSQPHNSGPTWCCSDSCEISEKDVESFSCDVYMGYYVTFMLVGLMQTYLFLYGGSYLCNVTHDLLPVMGILIIFSCLFDTIAVQGMYQTSKGYTCPGPSACIKHQREIEIHRPQLL